MIEKSLRKNNNEKIVRFPANFAVSLDLLGSVKLKLKDYNGIENLLLKSSKIRDSLTIDEAKQFNRLPLSEYYQATNQNVKAQKFAH